MPDFIYVAINKRGQKVSGEVEARDRERAVRKVHSYDLTITRFDPVKPAHWIWNFLEPIKPSILVLFIRELATMLGAGVTISRTLEVLTAHPGPRRFVRAVRRLGTDVQAGYSLSQAMLRAPEYFSAFLIGSVRVGEVSGRLAKTLDQCAGYVEKEYEYGLRLKNAFIYPTVLLGACGLLMAFIFNVMLPNFVSLFLDLSMKLPWPTQILVNTTRAWSRYGPNICATLAGPLAVAGWLFYRWSITPMGRIGVESILLRVPWYGHQVKNRMLARFFRSFATLMKAGVKVSSCLELLVRTLDREILIRSARSQLNSIHEGLTISQGMSLSGIFPPMAVELVYVGEETGRLDAVLGRLSDYFDEEMTRGLETISKLIEPVVLFVLGGFVGFILLAAFMPIYQLAGSF